MILDFLSEKARLIRTGIFLREALFTFGTLHPELRILSVPSVPFRIFEEILYGGSEVRNMSVVKYVIFGRFWRGPRKIPLLSRIKQ